MEIQKQFNLSIVRWQLFAKMNNGENRSKCLLAIWVLFLHFTYKNLFLPIGIFLFWICPWLRFHSYSDFKTVISVNFQNTGISSRFSESNFMKYTKSGIRVHTISMNRIKRLTASRRFDFRICISYSIPWMDRISKQDETKHRNTNKQKHTHIIACSLLSQCSPSTHNWLLMFTRDHIFDVIFSCF